MMGSVEHIQFYCPYLRDPQNEHLDLILDKMRGWSGVDKALSLLSSEEPETMERAAAFFKRVVRSPEVSHKSFE